MTARSSGLARRAALAIAAVALVLGVAVAVAALPADVAVVEETAVRLPPPVGQDHLHVGPETDASHDH